MSVNLLELVQQDLGYPELQKIDPNTQVMVEDANIPDEDKFSQAAIPAVLAGLYKYVQSDEGATILLRNSDSTRWVSVIFDDTKKEAVQTISIYSHQPNEDAANKMNVIATTAVKLVKENLPADAAPKEVKTFLKGQINNILLYLPAALNMGDLLHDDTLDDGTNKMEGPVSGIIRSIGDVFSPTPSGRDSDNSPKI
jgi:hypothetical protein